VIETSLARPVHILVFESRVEGHHLGYLKAITEELLCAGYRLTLAVNTSPKPYAKIRAEMGNILERVSIVPANDGSNGRTSIERIAWLFGQAQADFVFFPNLDEIGSAMMRRAAFGLLPPASLRGRLGGIYYRPRFLGDLGLSPNLWLKAAGFARLLHGAWFSHLLLLDPYLHARLKTREPDKPVFFLPDFFPAEFAADRAAARRQFELPANQRVFLFYGAGYRRKGLALTVKAMLAMGDYTPAFLLCAGKHAANRHVVHGLEQLVSRGRARVINRYVSNEEEKQLFAAGDVVLLPYRRHFGSSGILVRAIGAGLPVIVSDEELIGRLVRERDLGILFRSGDARALQQAIEHVAHASQQDMLRWQAAARTAAPNWTRAAFRDALVASFDHAVRRLTAQSGAG
jgi:glycosyltransferase involved in cell wall biosynthesis